MRGEFSEHEWTAIEPMLPNKPRGVRRLDDSRVRDGSCVQVRHGRRPAGDLWSRTTCYNRFVRWMMVLSR
jgi:transposase